MRNLRNTHRSLLERPRSRPLTACSWDTNKTSSVICAFGPTDNDILLELKRWRKYGREWEDIAAWDAPCPLPDLSCDKILDLHHFSDTATTVLVLIGGDLIVVREDPLPNEEKIEIVGSVDGGIAAAAWSPDEELLVLVTNLSTVLYMTRDFDNVSNIELTSDDFKVSDHVSVGWGKKETQFKGKKARALRDPTVPETIDEGLLHPDDNGKTNVSWRGDGAYVAVNRVQDSCRLIRVFSREGVLESVSEPTNFLVDGLSWRPAGNLIAGIQRLESEVKVIFFEKNGLRHGEFALRLTPKAIRNWAFHVDLIWNVDSTVLAVVFSDRVQLWQMGNYHYYLKQEIVLPDSYLGSFCWHPEKPLHFTLFDEDIVQRFSYASVIAHTPTDPPFDHGLVAVVDGKNLKLTPLRNANIPPPMALHEVEVAENIVDVAISARTSTSFRIAVLHDWHVSLIEWTLGSKPVISMTNHIEDLTPHAMPLQITAGAEDEFYVFRAGSTARVTRSTFIFQSGQAASRLTLPCEVLVPQSGALDSVSYIESGTWPHVDNNDSDMEVLSVSVPVVDSVRALVKSDKSKDTVMNGNAINGTLANIPMIFHLDEEGVLFANGRRILTACTSFLVTTDHLLFTTKNLLKFVHLGPRLEDLEVPPDTPETDERCRSLERGARLVTVMPSIFAVVLQMPRGNLETIYPRALVLAGIRDSINKKRYKKAFLACRNHRVDMNIIYDHAPQQFVDNIGLFIDKTNKPEYIDLFLSQLRDEDVSRTMYKETLRPTEPTLESVAEDSKVNRVCDHFLRHLQDNSGHLQNVITAHICKSPPDLDAALSRIAKLRKEKSDEVDSMIEHICFLADVNRLYDAGLGIYDLEVALLIAQQSQKDPKEYLPFLRNLQTMEPLRRQFAIDDHLKRHGKALQHLCNLEAFDEVKTYTGKHLLYGQAMSFYRYKGQKLEKLTRIYAEYLQREHLYKEAGIAYESLGDHVTASEVFRQAHLWQESLSNATQASTDSQQIHSLATALSDGLVESKDYASAATINLEYLSDTSNATHLLCKGYHFSSAIRIAGLYQRLDLLESVIDPGLQEGMGIMTDLLADCKSQLNAQTPRLRELRTKKAEDPLAFWEGDAPGGDIPDDISIAPTDASTTGGSLFTRYTNRSGTVGTNATRRTSKNRRREERKRARGKKGSVYEEEYLVNSIERLIQRVDDVREEVLRLIDGLVRRRMREQARAVENAMVEVKEMCTGCIEEVFQVEKLPEEQQIPKEPVENIYQPQGGDAVLLETLQRKTRPPPTIKEFERLKLLGG